MKKIIITTMAVLTAMALNAQTPPPQKDITDFTPTTEKKEKSTVKGQIFTIVEQMPEFPGGDSELLKYLGKNIKYPNVARDAGTQGTIFLSFVVDKKGKIKDVRVLRGLSGTGAKECAAEAVRVVKSMPKWLPGKQNKKPINVQYQLPIKFTLR